MDALAAAALIIRLYNTAAVPADELAAAAQAAEFILRDTGAAVALRQCGQQTGDACAEPLKPNEVVVRVIPAPAFHATLHPEAFGVTYIVKQTNRGWLATVFADRIHGAAERVGVDSGMLLGRVIAHEVGHLLLGLHYHGEAGVMAAEWPDEQLARDANSWRFSMREAEAMQHALRF